MERLCEEKKMSVKEVAEASGRTLTERVKALEKDMREVKKRLDAVETKGTASLGFPIEQDDTYCPPIAWVKNLPK